MLLEKLFNGGQIVVRRVQRELGQRRRNARARGNAQRRKPRARLDEKAIGMAVIAAFEFQDQVALGKSARDANRGHRRFGAGADEANALDRRHRAGDALAQFDFERRSHPIARAASRLIGNSGDNVRMRVAENQRAPGADVIDVLAPVHILQARAFRAIDHQRRAAHGAKCAHGAVHAADQNIFGALEELARALIETVLGSSARHVGVGLVLARASSASASGQGLSRDRSG